MKIMVIFLVYDIIDLLLLLIGGEFMDFNDSDAIRTMDTNSVLTNTFFRMFLGLLASAVTAIYTYYSGMYIDIVTSGASMV